MDKTRFSLLLLEPGEIYYEDYSSEMIGKGNPTLPGRLKICSKSVIFEPRDISQPLYKILFLYCDKISDKDNSLTILTQQHVTLLNDNQIKPYLIHRKQKEFHFKLNYVQVDECLQMILQLQRAASLPPPEQSCMIAAINYSRQSRIHFDLNWLEEISETLEIETEANWVTPLVVNPGRIVITSHRVYFQPFNNSDWYPVVKINLKSITEVKLRRFLQRQIGFELFCNGATVNRMYLTFKSNQDRQKIYDTIIRLCGVELSVIDPEIMTMKWQNHTISNYEYLEYINNIADRSLNDLTQYPVFPWVVADYTSSELNLDDPRTFRDLTKPIGALNPERLKRLKKRRTEMSEPSYLYGSHYSTPAFVLFYLIRKHPQLMLCLQNGRFDHPDRVFHSVADVWKNVLRNTSDFKELIPEFYDPSNEGDFLLNLRGLDLGMRHDGHRVHDVLLPPWCSSAQQCIQILRNALESSYVSSHLPAWIDLIFGCKQRGREAEEADNVFHPICYEGAIDLDSVKDFNERHALEVQIMEFGQVPKQIFRVPHPPKLSLAPQASLATQNDEKLLAELKVSILGYHRDTVTAVTCSGDTVLSVSRDSVLKEFNYTQKSNVQSVPIETIGISAVVCLPCKNSAILGTFDNRIILYDLSFNKLTDEVRAHEDAVSALSYNELGNLLASGSWDGSLRIWPDVSSHLGRLKCTSTMKFDHDSKVHCICVDKKGEIAGCGTEDGEALVYQLKTGVTLFEAKTDKGPVTAISLSCNNLRIIVGSMNGCRIHDLETGLLVYAVSSDKHITSLGWMTNNILLIGDYLGVVECWGLNTVKLIKTLETDEKMPITSIAPASSMEYAILSQSNRVLCLYSETI